MTNSMVMTRTVFQTARAKTIAAIVSVVASVALPQLFHMLGAALGVGAGLGQMFLPMHLPVLLVGMLAGPVAGLAAGLASPMASFVLSGMPAAGVLPFMVIELGIYGLTAGLMMRTRTHVAVKLLAAQIAGRAVRALAVLAALYGLGVQTASVMSIWQGIIDGWPGIAMQWAAIPLILYFVARRERQDAQR